MFSFIKSFKNVSLDYHEWLTPFKGVLNVTPDP